MYYYLEQYFQNWPLNLSDMLGDQLESTLKYLKLENQEPMHPELEDASENEVLKLSFL